MIRRTQGPAYLSRGEQEDFGASGRAEMKKTKKTKRGRHADGVARGLRLQDIQKDVSTCLTFSDIQKDVSTADVKQMNI